MIKIKKPAKVKSVVCDMELAGQKFEIELMPMTEADRMNAFSQFRKLKHIRNPVSKQMEAVPYFEGDANFQAATDDLLDKVIVTFHGIGDETGELDGTLRENKLLLGSITVEDTEAVPITDEAGEKAVIYVPRTRKFSALILEKAVSLSEAFVEAETKNS